MILNRTRVEMIQNIDVSNIGWCNEAVIFHVINGKVHLHIELVKKMMNMISILNCC